jgi:hypothetical protein
MMNVPVTDTILSSAGDTFDTTRIAATVNRLLDNEAALSGRPQVVELSVRGQVPSNPTRLLITGRVLYRTNNCVATIPMEVDAGAFKGLESGIAAD